jgi:NAD(P)-dependent dehydrogenase (short-subunit alcohol dehydrogenase family)
MTQTPENVPAIDDWSRLLEGRVALVTGGGDGIGGGISRLFAQHGAIVEVAEIDPERAASVVSDIEADGGRARAHIVDVRKADDVDRLRDAVLAEYPAPDILVNNVGDYRPIVRFHDSTPDSWNEMYEINFLHAVQVTRAFLQPMIDNGGASIINIHSVEGMRGYPGEPIYGAMKAALAHFTTCIAAGYGRMGIRANGIGPDLIQSPQVDYLKGFEELEDLWESWAPVGRLGWPEDTARAALFLASDMSSYVTGHNIPVDGGTKAGGGWFFSPTDNRFVNRPKTL